MIKVVSLDILDLIGFQSGILFVLRETQSNDSVKVSFYSFDIETKSIAECYSALTMLDYSSEDADSIADDFKMTVENVTAASVTYAIRDTEIDGVSIKTNDFMAIVGKKIVAANPSKVDVVKDLFAKVDEIEYKEVVTLIYGLDVSEEEKQEVVSYLNETYPHIEIGELDGKQDIYSFIISIE